MEERETRLKATGFFRTLGAGESRTRQPRREAQVRGAGVRMLLVDNDDCFIHTLANYARQTGRGSGYVSRRIPAGADRERYGPT